MLDRQRAAASPRGDDFPPDSDMAPPVRFCPHCGAPFAPAEIIVSNGWFSTSAGSIRATKGEAAILALLIANKGKFVCMERLIARYATILPWDRDCPRIATVRVVVSHMRPKLRKLGCEIEGRRCSGYRFVES